MKEKKCAAVLMGSPGSGKTTVARALAAQQGIMVIEMGNLLGAEVKRGTALGGEIAPYQAAGDLVPSELVKRVILAELEKSHDGAVLFDGFPRDAGQVELLTELLQERDLALCAIFNLNVDAETVMKRLSGRRLCQKCGALYNIHANAPRQEGRCDKCGGDLAQRRDDKPEVVRRRFENYERETVPVMDRFRREHKELCLEVAAGGPMEEVLKSVRHGFQTAMMG